MTETEWDASEDSQALLAWLTADRGPSGYYVRHDRPISDRKLRLFACACCRSVWHLLTDDRSRKAVEVAEKYADSSTFAEELIFAHHAANEAMVQSRATFEAELAWRCAGNIDGLTSNNGLPRWFSVSTKLAAVQASLLRDVVGNPWHPLTCGWEQTDQEQVWRADWCITADVVRLAQAAYDERHPESGHLDPVRLLVLADALEEAGCSDDAILDHLHGWDLMPCPTSCRKVQGTYRIADGGICPSCHGSSGGVPTPHVRGCWALDAILGKE